MPLHCAVKPLYVRIGYLRDFQCLTRTIGANQVEVMNSRRTSLISTFDTCSKDRCEQLGRFNLASTVDASELIGDACRECVTKKRGMSPEHTRGTAGLWGTPERRNRRPQNSRRGAGSSVRLSDTSPARG